MLNSQSYDPGLTAILEPRTYERELYGFRGGRFNPDRSKFFAYTYARLDSVEFDDYHAIFLDINSHSSVGADTERQMKWVDDRSYQMKDMEECIKEGIYLAWSFRFTGILYEQEWYVQKELIFWGEQLDEKTALAHHTRRLDDPDFWNKGMFGPPYVCKTPAGLPIRNIEEEEFEGMPWLVSSIKIEEKGKINRAFERYMNLALVHPFLQRMRIGFPDEFVDFSSLFGENYTLLYSGERTYFLLVTMAKHRVEGYRLVWFFYEPTAATFYKWTYPQPRHSGWRYWYVEDVIVDLKDICEWNDSGFLNSSRTLDDPRFWSEYVLAHEGGRHLWLEPINGEAANSISNIPI